MQKETASEKTPALAEPYLSKAIGRALDVLECFEDDKTQFGLKEIAMRAGMPESSLFRILVTLEARGYLQQDAQGCYRLAPRVLFGKLRERADRLKELAHPVLRRLASHYDETASLAFLFENQIQVLDSVEALHEVRVINKPGRVLAPHCSSLGKAITAFQEQPLVDRILEVYGLYRRTAKSVIDRGTLLSDFERIRIQGYAVDREEAVEGGVCIGAPVQLKRGNVFAAVSLSSPIARITPDREKDIIQGVCAAAREIADLLDATQ
jgi:DNA-binding IclR family transcriptional regulator